MRRATSVVIVLLPLVGCDSTSDPLSQPSAFKPWPEVRIAGRVTNIDTTQPPQTRRSQWKGIRATF